MNLNYFKTNIIDLIALIFLNTISIFPEKIGKSLVQLLLCECFCEK